MHVTKSCIGKANIGEDAVYVWSCENRSKCEDGFAVFPVTVVDIYIDVSSG